MKILALAFFVAAAAACSDNPPLIGAGDASKDQSADGVLPGNDAGGDVTASDGPSTCTLSSPPSDATCAACLASSCCTEWNTCSANSDCAGYVACVRACPADAGAGDAGPPPPPDAGFGDGGDTSPLACITACENKYPNGSTDGTNLIGCEDSSCAGKCN